MSSGQDTNRVTMLAIAAALVLGAVVLALWDPAQNSFFPRCPFFELTGLHCPGCGSQRAVHQLAHGNFASAFFLNPLATLAIPFLTYGLLATASERLLGKRLPHIHIKSGLIWLLAFTVIAFGLLRNVPVYPFVLFAPNWQPLL